MAEAITLNYLPFDSHVHFRRGHMLKAVAPYTARQCWGGIVMPNTATPHIVSVDNALAYRQEIKGAITDWAFEPRITGYLTPTTTAQEVVKGFDSNAWSAMKVYPPGATTHSNEGVSGKYLLEMGEVLCAMQEVGMPLLLHGEISMEDDMMTVVDIYDREKRFLYEIVGELRVRYPRLKISLEHITTTEMVEFMIRHGEVGNLVCTITPQHLLYDRRDLHADGFQPHLFCYPILKREGDRDALRRLVGQGFAFVSAGTDSAPHPTHAKEKACGCAGGVFTAHAMVQLYAQIFDMLGALPTLESFLCGNGPRFYGLVPYAGQVILEKKAWTVDEMIQVTGGDKIRPFGYHEDSAKRFKFEWQIV